MYACIHSFIHVCVHANSFQSCPTICKPMDCSLPGSSVQGILQTRILEWVAMPSSSGSPQSRDWTHVSYISWVGRQILYHYATCIHLHIDLINIFKFYFISGAVVSKAITGCCLHKGHIISNIALKWCIISIVMWPNFSYTYSQLQPLGHKKFT